jgi:HEAT repeat protein
MLGDDESIPRIEQMLEESVHRPDLLRLVSVALAVLGHRPAAPRLVELLGEDKSFEGIAAISASLALIGDRSSIDPLVALLRDGRLNKAGRSMAAAALGGIADKDLLPWNAGFTANVNYRAALGTFANGGTGVFEIL